MDELPPAALAYAAETPWKEGGRWRGLWVIFTPMRCLYFRGARSQDILAQVGGGGVVGGRMRAGYQGYRQFRQRLRCWAQRLRKAEGLKQCLNAEARAFGQAAHALRSDLMAAIYQARDGLPRTKHDLEPLVGGVRPHLRRAPGQKSAPASLVVGRVTRRPAAVASRTPRFTAVDVVPPNLERWRATRPLRKQRRLPRLLGRRFRQDPEAYLRKLKARLVKLRLPP